MFALGGMNDLNDLSNVGLWQQVGQGIKPKICRSTCSSWLEACRQDFFGFYPSTGLLVRGGVGGGWLCGFQILPYAMQVPCTSSASARLLVCSRLDVLLIHLRDNNGKGGMVMTDDAAADQLCSLAGE